MSRGVPRQRWGPYVSERQWGTVRKDYSADGAAGSISGTTMRAVAPIVAVPEFAG
jgi:hypothetical protein